MIYYLIAIATILILSIYREWVFYKDKQMLVDMIKESHLMLEDGINKWNAERKDLLDRIQAPTFADYTNKVVREKKAEQPEEPKVDYDQFIS